MENVFPSRSKPYNSFINVGILEGERERKKKKRFCFFGIGVC